MHNQKWKFSWWNFLAASLAIVGVITMLYPTMAAWFSQKNQSAIAREYVNNIQRADPSAEQQLSNAHAYNQSLHSGAVLGAFARVPSGTGSDFDSVVPYKKQLVAPHNDVMARIRIEKIGVDLPIYHGTDDSTLLRGAGHLEGTSLPVGGLGSHSVLTAHRGLASARMFSDLNKIGVGDIFSIQVMNDVLTYQIRDTKVVAPEQTEFLRPDQGRDLITLVTCTPLGVNTHRILVTAERITPTPQSEIQALSEDPGVPGFPWWAVIILVVVLLAGILFWFGGRPRQLRKKVTGAHRK